MKLILMINRFKIVFCISINEKAARMSSLLFQIYFFYFLMNCFVNPGIWMT